MERNYRLSSLGEALLLDTFVLVKSPTKLLGLNKQSFRNIQTLHDESLNYHYFWDFTKDLERLGLVWGLFSNVYTKDNKL